MSSKAKAYAALAFGVLVVAWAAILIRWAGKEEPPSVVTEVSRWLLGWPGTPGWAGPAQAPPLVISAGRLTLSALILLPLALARGAPRELRALSRRDLFLALLAGVALAVHFATWITSLTLTTVASSVVLVETNPLFVALASHFLLRERVSRLAAVGILVAVLGSALVGFGDFALSGWALLGDALALIGGLMAAAYFLLGRRLRQRLSIVAYVWPVYTVAAAVLLAICLGSGEPLVGYTPATYLLILLLAVGPQVLGHSSLNYALGQLPATLVTVAALGEPIGAALLAFLLLREAPGWLVLAGGAFILGGIALTSLGEAREH